MPSLVAAFSLAVSPVHITLVFAPEHRLRPTVERQALAETAALWAPYGVLVTAAEPACPDRHDDLQLAVVMSVAPDAADAAWQMPLGAVNFDAEGTPARLLTVFLDRLVRMLEDSRLRDVPKALRERLVGRAIGRIIAHEIGHILLRSKHHTERGLMRAVQRPDELVDPARSRYKLN